MAFASVKDGLHLCEGAGGLLLCEYPACPCGHERGNVDAAACMPPPLHLKKRMRERERCIPPTSPFEEEDEGEGEMHPTHVSI